jgi:Yip1 domain
MSDGQRGEGGASDVIAAAAAGSPPAERMSIPEACFTIFFAPSRVFAEWQNRGWVIPLIVLTVLVALLYYGGRPYLQPAIDAELTRQNAAMMRSNPQLTPDKMEAARGMQEKFAVVGVVLGVPIVVVVLGFTLWFVGRFVDSKQVLSTAFGVATFAYFPRLLGWVASGVIGFLRDPSHLTGLSSLTLGPGFFLDAGTASPLLIAIVTRLDIVTLWVTVLLAIGLHVTGKVPKGQAAMAAAVIWIIGALPGLFSALRAAG